MNRIVLEASIPVQFIATIDEAMNALHQRCWSAGHAAFGRVHQVTGLKDDVRFIAEADTELAAWLLACQKANELESASP